MIKNVSISSYAEARPVQKRTSSPESESKISISATPVCSSPVEFKSKLQTGVRLSGKVLTPSIRI